MGIIDTYKQIIRKELEFQAGISFANASELSRHLIINTDQTEFVLLTVGWQDKKYHHGVLFHVEIKDNKVWVHQENIDVGIAEIFAKEGIPKSEIILGFLPWYSQEVSEFGMAKR